MYYVIKQGSNYLVDSSEAEMQSALKANKLLKFNTRSEGGKVATLLGIDDACVEKFDFAEFIKARQAEKGNSKKKGGALDSKAEVTDAKKLTVSSIYGDYIKISYPGAQNLYMKCKSGGNGAIYMVHMNPITSIQLGLLHSIFKNQVLDVRSGNTTKFWDLSDQELIVLPDDAKYGKGSLSFVLEGYAVKFTQKKIG